MIKQLKKHNLIYFLLVTIFLFIDKKTYTRNQDSNFIQSHSNTINSSHKEEANIYLNFENANLSSVINYICEEKKINFIPNKSLENIKISLTTKEPLTLTKTWDLLLTMLEVNGHTIINVDGLYRIVAKGQNKQEPLPIFSGIEPEQLPKNDEVIRFIYFLKNIKADTVAQFLSQMLEGQVQTNPSLNALIITERSLFIKSAMKIITELDQGGLRESIKIIHLKYAIAEDVAKIFKEIVPSEQQKDLRFLLAQANKKQATYFSQDTQIITEPRRNALILLGLEKNLTKIIDFIHKYVDIPIDKAKSRIHIKELKYAKAENLKPLLKNIIQPPVGINKALQVGEYKFFEDVLIEIDSSTVSESGGGGNRLIISCGNEDWKRLERLIDNIDKPQPQVAFEIMVVDITTKNDNELWSQFKPKKIGNLGVNTDIQFMTALNTAPSAAPDTRIDLIGAGAADSTSLIRKDANTGTNITFGHTTNLWGIVKAILEQENYNVIIQPYITTNNNQECQVDFTIERQVKGSMSSKSAATGFLRDKETKQAPTSVRLTPKVNLNGTVDLRIFVDVEEFQEDDQTSPNSTVRKLETKVNVGTGEVLILGGLTKNKHVEDVYKVPVLGDIPIIGNLFKTKKNLKEKSNLYIFIRPSIIKPRFEGVLDEYTQLKLDFAKHQILDSDTYIKDKDPIQRWFFRPSKQTVKQKIADAKIGMLRPIDDYSSCKNQPKEVNIKYDPYFRIVDKSKIKGTPHKDAIIIKQNNTKNRVPKIKKEEIIKSPEKIEPPGKKLHRNINITNILKKDRRKKTTHKKLLEQKYSNINSLFVKHTLAKKTLSAKNTEGKAETNNTKKSRFKKNQNEKKENHTNKILNAKDPRI